MHVAMMRFVQTLKAASVATAQKVMMASLITDCVHLLKLDVLLIRNVVPTLNVFNPVNVSVPLHSLSMLETSVEIHAKDLIVESMLNVHQQTVSTYTRNSIIYNS